MTSPIVNQVKDQHPSFVVGGDVRANGSDDRTEPGAGAPRKRGSGATLLTVYRPLALRAVGIACALFTVAWLGERDSQRTVYGELVEVSAKLPPSGDPSAAGREPQRASGGAPEPRDPSPVAPPETASPKADGAPPCTASGASAGPPAVTSDGRVILNEATVRELTTLPGVGEKRAEAILALRARLGRFDKPAQLLRVRGIGPKSLAKLMPKFVLDRPVEPAPAASTAPASLVGPSGAPPQVAPSAPGPPASP